ncbi:MAG: hypothetical protein ACOC57_04485 [Acidobacteriota bacterium]
MKIDRHKLQQEMAGLLAENRPPSRKKCPSPRALLAFFRGKLNQKSAGKLADHLSTCFYCAGESAAIREIIKNEKNLIQDIEKLHQSSGRKVSFINWRFAAGLTGAAALLLLIFFLINPFSNRDYRAHRDSPFSVQAPRYQSSPHPALVFQWEKVEKARAYSLELFDPALYPLWKSPRTETNRLKLPDNVLDQLEKSKIYFWVLTAYLEGGEKIESPLYHFTYNLQQLF